MKSSMLYRYLLLIFFIPGVLYAQRPHHKGDQILVLPKVGTMLVNTYYVTDSSGALVPKSVADPKLDDDTLFVIRSGVQVLGRANCVVLAAKSHPDTTLISYAPNGDLYMRGLNGDSVWSMVPFGMAPGKKTMETLPKDSGFMYGFNYDMPHERTVEVLGHDTASVGAKVYNCIKLQVVDIRKYQGTDWLQGTLFWYSPELGYIVRLNAGWNGKYFLNQQLKIWQ
jgi:hypothetical protein